MTDSDLTTQQRSVLDRIDAAFGFGSTDQRSRQRVLSDATAGWERMISRLEALGCQHAAWRAAMAVKNPCALAIHADRAPHLERQIERYRACRQAALSELRASAETA